MLHPASSTVLLFELSSSTGLYFLESQTKTHISGIPIDSGLEFVRSPLLIVFSQFIYQNGVVDDTWMLCFVNVNCVALLFVTGELALMT